MDCEHRHVQMDSPHVLPAIDIEVTPETAPTPQTGGLMQDASGNGVTYHLQQLVLWQWFADMRSSNAFGGWFTFPIPHDLTVPAVYCP